MRYSWSKEVVFPMMDTEENTSQQGEAPSENYGKMHGND